jgi:hypothetical protein
LAAPQPGGAARSPTFPWGAVNGDGAGRNLMARAPWVFVVDEAGLIVALGAGRIDCTADMAAGRLRPTDRRLSPGPHLARFLDHRGEEAFRLRKWVALPPRDVCDGRVVLWCPFALLLLAILSIELREAGINMTVGRAVTRPRELGESLMAYTAGAVDRVLNDLDDTQARLQRVPTAPTPAVLTPAFL